MTSKRADTISIAVAGLLALAMALGVLAFDPGGALGRIREAVFDRLLLLNPRDTESGRVVVVDINRAALMTHGNWPWPRPRLAELVEKIAAAKPRVIAVNILLPENAGSAGTEADRRLASALRNVPSVLALVLDPDLAGTPPPSVPLAVNGEIRLPGMFMTPGVVSPAAALLPEADGLGVISLPAPEGQPVRKVFLLAGGGQSLLPGFAVETMRIAASSATLIASAPPQRLRAGDATIPLAADAEMRVRYATPAARQARTIAAGDVFSSAVPADALKDKIVLLGVSAPEAGGLRLTPADPFMPGVQIEAEAIETILSGRIPQRHGWSQWLELAAASIMGLAGIATTVFWRAGRAAAAGIAMPAAWIGAAALSGIGFLQLFDPVAPAAAASLGVIAAALTRYRRSNLRRAAIERRFALHLSPEVVRRISENPDELKVKGERRIITALFADIEGFTETTERIGAERMVELLDRYVDTVAGLVISHGGMVDKIVGDGIVAFFNAPLDLPDHTAKAIRCAETIIAATEALRGEPDIRSAGLGRTRIGIETGPAMLGDVGRGAKRNYTAMGSTVNMAARLEAANKALGTSVLIGPRAAAAAGNAHLVSKGLLSLPGIVGKVEAFAPVMAPQTAP